MINFASFKWTTNSLIFLKVEKLFCCKATINIANIEWNENWIILGKWNKIFPFLQCFKCRQVFKYYFYNNEAAAAVFIRYTNLRCFCGYEVLRQIMIYTYIYRGRSCKNTIWNIYNFIKRYRIQLFSILYLCKPRFWLTSKNFDSSLHITVNIFKNNVQRPL